MSELTQRALDVAIRGVQRDDGYVYSVPAGQIVTYNDTIRGLVSEINRLDAAAAVTRTRAEYLLEEAKQHRLAVGPNYGISVSDGVYGTPIGGVLRNEADLVQRLAAFVDEVTR